MVVQQYGGVDLVDVGWPACADRYRRRNYSARFFRWGVALASRKSAVLACALAPFLWVTLEFARAHLPIIAFPWNLTGYAASGNLALVQLTTLTGIYGLSFLVAGVRLAGRVRDPFRAAARVEDADFA